jgi:hypothetical protein
MRTRKSTFLLRVQSNYPLIVRRLLLRIVKLPQRHLSQVAIVARRRRCSCRCRKRERTESDYTRKKGAIETKPNENSNQAEQANHETPPRHEKKEKRSYACWQRSAKL